MLQNYLNLNLIDVTDDEIHRKLQKAADELVKRLQKSKLKVADFALAAIDAEISPENPSILETRELILKNWTTFTANAKDSPLVFIRAVILESLNSLLVKDNYAEVIWFATRNIVKYLEFTSNERDVIFDFLQKIGESINHKGVKSWTLEESEKKMHQEIELKNIASYLINDETLTGYMEDASGPYGKSGEANYSAPNPSWSNSATTWSHEFAPRAAKGIKKTVDLSLNVIASAVNENSKTVQKVLNENLNEQPDVNNNKILALRSQLLWWKEAGYSDSAHQGYDELDKNIIKLILAYDYSEFIPPIYPKSVDYFLAHAYKSIHAESVEELSLNDYFEGINKNSDLLKSIFPETHIAESPSNLLNFTFKLLRKQVSISELQKVTGIPLETKLNVKDLVLWLFHDFILLKILKQK